MYRDTCRKSIYVARETFLNFFFLLLLILFIQKYFFVFYIIRKASSVFVLQRCIFSLYRSAPKDYSLTDKFSEK